MDMYSKYQSPLGYNVGENGIDSYGVDHKNFTLQDEVQYQNLRHNREQGLIKQLNEQGITENYPQYGTNFWGVAENNYGFGDSNIVSAVQNHQSLNTTPIPLNNPQISGSMDCAINTESFVSQPSSLVSVFPQYTVPASVEQKSQPQMTVYQSLSGFAQNNEKWYENNPQKDSFNYERDEYETNKLINDCLKSDRFRQFISSIKRPEREGYGFHISDQPTNSGISQGLYDLFLQKYPQIAKVYPSKVKDLTQEQVDNIHCQEFYKPNHIETFNDNHTAEHIFDIGVNIGGQEGTKIIQNAYNDVNAQNIGIDGRLGTETVSAINQLQNDDLLRLNNQIVNRRYEYYDSLKDKDKYPGWYTRAKSFKY